MARVAVWLTNYNSEKHIGKAIESVLKQSFADFTLYVFDNHSTDGAPEAIWAKAAKDARVVKVEIPSGLAGIPLMNFAWDKLNEGDQEYSITLGGHDFWPNERHLEILVNRAEFEAKSGRETALIYTDTWQVNEADEIIGRFQNIVQEGGQTSRPFLPQHIISSVDSPQLFGLWVEKARRAVPFRHQCAGWDHLVVMNAALHGAILWEPNTPLVMRCPPPGDGLHKYAERHFSAAARKGGDQDFIKQLEWLVACIDEACVGTNSIYPMLLTASMFATYVCLRGYNLDIFEDGLRTFNTRPKVQEILRHLVDAAQKIRTLVTV